jgi:hypothetical protein
MQEIDRLLQLIESPNPSKRYDACEELRVADAIPTEAIVALQRATGDPDHDVADAAWRALALHAINRPPSAPGDAQAPIAIDEPAHVAIATGCFGYLAAVVLVWVILAPGVEITLLLAFFLPGTECPFLPAFYLPPILGPAVGILLAKRLSTNVAALAAATSGFVAGLASGLFLLAATLSCGGGIF